MFKPPMSKGICDRIFQLGDGSCGVSVRCGWQLRCSMLKVLYERIEQPCLFRKLHVFQLLNRIFQKCIDSKGHNQACRRACTWRGASCPNLAGYSLMALELDPWVQSSCQLTTLPIDNSRFLMRPAISLHFVNFYINVFSRQI